MMPLVDSESGVPPCKAPNFDLFMALKSTIYKAHLQIADMDRQVYADHALTLALHPSETEERLLIRLLAFALEAQIGRAHV